MASPLKASAPFVAAMESSASARRRLDRRLPDLEASTREVAAWERGRDAAVAKVDRHFATDDARVKLERPYPAVELR